jgi:hypothetical protein
MLKRSSSGPLCDDRGAWLLPGDGGIRRSEEGGGVDALQLRVAPAFPVGPATFINLKA